MSPFESDEKHPYRWQRGVFTALESFSILGASHTRCPTTSAAKLDVTMTIKDEPWSKGGRGEVIMWAAGAHGHQAARC